MPNPKKPKNANKVTNNKEKQSSTVQFTSGTAESDAPQKDTVREKLANFYVKGYIFIIAGVLFVLLLGCYTINDIKDLLLALSGVLSGPLGFIIGFYFKEDIKGNK